MKKILFVLALFVCVTSVQAKQFIIRDTYGIKRQYTIDQDFLEHFVEFIRNRVPNESKPFFADIYLDLQKEGEDIVYYDDRNTISGLDMNHWQSLTPKQAARMYGNATSFDAIFNTKKQQFYSALDCLNSFYYTPSIITN